tara:strand:- start:2702 stop:5512 length:2811 start_codon:yes stop_codon:yes gene_type:complete
MANALTLQWSFGFSREIPGGVITLCDGTRNALFYAAAQSGIIYDYSARRQNLLQGHCNPISCAVVSPDKKWLITADSGGDSLVVVWDSETGSPVRTIFNPHTRGVLSIDVTSDATFLALLSGFKSQREGGFQEISIWEWASSRDVPMLSAQIASAQQHTSMRFNVSDVRELITNGESTVYFWSWENAMTCYSPRISRRNFRQPVGKFTVSIFLPGSTQAVTATSDGSLILWDMPLEHGGQSNANVEPSNSAITERIAVKVIRLCEGAINYLTTVETHLVVAGNDGAVRMYDHLFRLEAWFEDLNAGPVVSVSFATKNIESLVNRGQAPHTTTDDSQEQLRSLQSKLPDFLVGTKSATIIHLHANLFQAVLPEDRRGTVVVQGMADEVHGIALHPTKSYILITCYSGGLYLWDYNIKTLRMVRLFDPMKLRPHCISFDHVGLSLAVGFTSGTVKVLDPVSLSDIGASFKNGKAKILFLEFSLDSNWLAAADAAHSVALWKKVIVLETVSHEPQNDALARDRGEQHSELASLSAQHANMPTWVYIGRYFSHSRPVTGLKFGRRETDVMVLVSVAEDKKLVEYNLASSTVDSGVLIAGIYSIEEGATPTACLWHPPLHGDFEERIITANSEFKLRQWNADNKLCRRTSLSPTFGGPASGLEALGKSEGQSDFLAYSAESKVVGIIKLPLDGNPNKSMGIIAHPGNLSGIAATSCGQQLFTAGGNDQTVNFWSVQRAMVDALEAAGGRAMEPYLASLPVGAEQDVYEKMVDYFYYLQLRRQGEETTTSRKVLGAIHLSDVPRLMRAIGYYPSEQEVVNIISEIKYSTFTTSGQITESVDLHTFIRLYVNHRPVSGVKMHQIHQALAVIHARISPGIDADYSTNPLSWRQLQTMLESCGEKFSHQELSACLLALNGDPRQPSILTIPRIVTDILGFKEDSK